MKTDSLTFDENLAKWTTEQGQPWARLKYRLTQSNLAKHLPGGQLRILDAGGGNGVDSIALAEMGHTVDIVDYSTAMLADAERRAAQLNVTQRVTVHNADLVELPNLFRDRDFDLVLCHNVVQYASDVPDLLKDLTGLLKVGGVMSIVSVNRYSIPYHAAFFGGDLTDALAKLGTSDVSAYIFGATMTTFTAEEVSTMLRDSGCSIEQDYGIRCMCDYWGDTERKSRPETFEQIEQLEFALTNQYPYKLLARYFQVIVRKIESDNRP